ncbi:MAG: nucleotidyltransferase domain-containing protein [Chitinivibrionales bacterium]|nr:nucleotidyltransferase domain-containing protein [Chitinivibrionales bacterium]
MIDVTREQLVIITDILQRYVPDAEVRAFGSRCTNNAKKHSDLDLVIVGNTAIGYSLLSVIKETFQESDLPFRVDVVDWNTLSLEFRSVIAQNNEIIQKAPI